MWWKEKLLNYQNTSKYYEHDCLQNILLFIRPYLAVLVVK